MAANRVRIIGGLWRSRLIEFPNNAGVRPTSDRIRETLFNWLGQDLTGQTCLDLFAGSGALGFEALSRGAQAVVMVESDRSAYLALLENARRLGANHLQVHAMDAERFLRQDHLKYDVIFLDPPYKDTDFMGLMRDIAPHLATQGLLYVENSVVLAPPEDLELLRHKRAGSVHAHLMRKASRA